MSRPNRTIATLAAMTAIILFGACSGKESGTAEKEEAKPLVRVETVTEQDVDQQGVYTASVEADVINNISAQMANRIKEIYVDEGMRVSKGQKLVLLDDVNTTNYQLQLDNARAALRNVETDYNRALELYKIGGGTKQQVDQMETQLINARTAVATAERTLRNARENTLLVSPISGVVTARNYDPGDMTGALPVLTVARVQPVKIVLNLPESELSTVSKGMHADVTFDTYGDEVFPGTITLLSPTVDAASRTFSAEVTLPNADSRLLPGMFGRVRLNHGTKRRVVVPDMAVVKQPGSGNHFIYVYSDGKVKYAPVELGQRLDKQYEIISGVEPGAQVVVSGQNRLADGMEADLLK